MSEYDSGELPVDQPYTLQKYTFTIQSMYDDENDITGVTAKMTHDGQTEVQGIDIEGRAEIESWKVEANENTADVYVNVGTERTWTAESLVNNAGADLGSNNHGNYVKSNDGQAIGIWNQRSPTNGLPYLFSPNRRAAAFNGASGTMVSDDGDTWYWYSGFGEQGAGVNSGGLLVISTGADRVHPDIDYVLSITNFHWIEDNIKTQLVGRFSIDIPDPDPDPGTPDPGDNWEEPESTGDPDYTLKVKIIGALSGRHNDPLHDTSVSFTPADQISVKGYGGGGDGGHGGGGGAGASTIIVRRFVTDKAGSIEVTAITKRHGYGSGGGKGGRGGDGCILVFY